MNVGEQGGNKAAVVVLLDEDQRVLVHNRERKTTTKEKFGFLGGKIETGETELEGAIRETIEETGYRPDDLRLFKYYRADPLKTHGLEIFVFTGKFPGFSRFQDSSEVELKELELVHISNAQKLNFFPIAYEILEDLQDNLE